MEEIHHMRSWNFDISTSNIKTLAVMGKRSKILQGLIRYRYILQITHGVTKVITFKYVMFRPERLEDL